MVATVLIVDDEPDVEAMMRQRFRHSLRQGRHRFLFARDGAEALEILARDHDIDAVLTDINMPGMDGLTLLGHVLERHPLLRTVVVSAFGDMLNIRTAMNRGAFDFVTKPIDFGDLEATLAKAVTSAKELRDSVQRRQDAEQARSNLSRYFAPSMVELLATQDDPFGAPRAQDVVVMFVDIVGFTKICGRESPQDVFGLLRAFFAQMSVAVFSAGGTVDKYLGDGLMATFGTPLPGPHDATNALRCALAIKHQVEAANAARAAAGQASLRIGVGLHYGPVLLGNIGDERRLEFATIGDTVNVASRLEGLSRPLDTMIVLSQEMTDRARREGGDADGLLTHFVQRAPQRLRGKEQDVLVWTCD